MDDGADLDVLPRAYALALRLTDLGADEELIGDCLDVDPRAVGPMVTIARQKLANAARPDQVEAQS